MTDLFPEKELNEHKDIIYTSLLAKLPSSYLKETRMSMRIEGQFWAADFNHQLFVFLMEQVSRRAEGGVGC
jgi:hypothetical protein